MRFKEFRLKSNKRYNLILVYLPSNEKKIEFIFYTDYMWPRKEVIIYLLEAIISYFGI